MAESHPDGEVPDTLPSQPGQPPPPADVTVEWPPSSASEKPAPSVDNDTLLPKTPANHSNPQAETTFPLEPVVPRVDKTKGLPVLPGYQILQVLGRGGMGVVYKARNLGLNRVVALKMIRSGEHASIQEVTRFRVEAEAVARLQHPNIVQIYEVGQDDGFPFLSLEYVDGISLDRKLAGNPQPVRPAAQLVETLARAIHLAHQRGIIHRDLKPANVLLASEDGEGTGSVNTQQGRVDQLYGLPKITDFGLAKRLDGEAGQTQSGEVLGTPSYMAPEQATGNIHSIGPAADVYALGAILYEMLTGRPPFKAETMVDTLHQVVFDEVVAPRRLQPKLPRDLETICLKCLDKVPGQRYSSALALAEDLRRFQEGEPLLARPISGPLRLWRWCQRNPVAASLLIAVTLGSAFGLWHLSRLSHRIVENTALESVIQQSEALGEVNDFYSEVVKRAKAGGVVATHDYGNQKNTIPIPATFTIDLGKRISGRSEAGVQVRMYSDFPFLSRHDGGPKDEFERQALVRLRAKPDEPVYEFSESQGRQVLRYATARRMQASCVSCHNTHPDSPKKDWKEGDVRGVLEIIRPLDRDIAKTRQGLKGTFFLVALISLTLLALSGMVLFWGRRQRVFPAR